MSVSSTLTINGTAYNQSARRAANYLIDGWGWDLDGGYWLEFHEHSSGPQPKLTGPVPVSLSVNISGTATTVFSGDMVSVSPAMDARGRRTWGYRCLGLEYRASWIPVTAQDGSGLQRFNVSPTNVMYYTPSTAGMSVGQILSSIFTSHASALSAAGITTDATTTAELSPLTLVPNSEVQIAGERLWTALQGFLQQWARNIRLMINGSGLIRLVDVTAGAAHTLTMGSDPIDPPLFSRNWTSSATKVTVRGQGVIEPGYVSVGRGTLTAAWTAGEQSSWTYSDFTNPNGPSVDSGTVTSVTSATTVTIQSSNALRTWGTNYWDGIQAWIYLSSTSGSGLTYTESRPVTACGSMSAGGTCTITLAYALQNSASGAYNQYTLIGTDVPLGSGGLYNVWRLYNVTDPGSQIANHLVPNFPVQVPFIGWNGESATLTNGPTCQIVGANSAGPAQFTVLPATGQVLFIRPVVEQVNSIAALNSGTYAAPVDVYMLLAYSRGALTTSYPSSGYTGTAYTKAGLSRTQYVDQYDWSYYGNSSVMNGLAQMLCVAVSNTLTEGTISYKGLYSVPQDPTGGYLLNIAATTYTTGDESLAIPLRGYTVRYLTEGGGLNYATQLRCSNRQDPRTGAGFYDHLSVLGSGLRFGSLPEGGFGGGAPQFAGMSGFGFQQPGEAPDWGPTGDDRPQGPRRKRTRLQPSLWRSIAATRHGAQDRYDAEANEDIALDREGGGDVYVNPDAQRAANDQARSRRRLVARDNARRARTLRRTPRPGELVYGGRGAGGEASGEGALYGAAGTAVDQAERAGMVDASPPPGEGGRPA